MNAWLLIPIAVVIVVLWAGWYVFAFMADRRRSAEVASDVERLDVHHKGPTSTPREQQREHVRRDPADRQDGSA
jgi:hypothetical protein